MRLLSVLLVVAAVGCSGSSKAPWDARLMSAIGEGGTITVSFHLTSDEAELIEKNRTSKQVLYGREDDGSLDETRVPEGRVSDIQAMLYVVRVFPPSKAGQKRVGTKTLPPASASGRYEIEFDLPADLGENPGYLSLEVFRSYSLKMVTERKVRKVEFGGRVGGRVEMTARGGGGRVTIVTLHSDLLERR